MGCTVSLVGYVTLGFLTFRHRDGMLLRTRGMLLAIPDLLQINQCAKSK